MDKQQVQHIADLLHQLDKVAVLALQRGDLPGAEQSYQELLRAELSLHLEPESARTRINLASLYLLMKQPEQALAQVQEAVAVFTRCAAMADLILACQIKARVLCALGRAAEAVQEAEHALLACRSDKSRAETALVLLDCCIQSRDLWKARRAADRAVRFFELCGDRDGLCRALQARVRLFERLRQSGAAAADRARLASMGQEE